jgi:hypothetical protein
MMNIFNLNAMAWIKKLQISIFEALLPNNDPQKFNFEFFCTQL